MHTIDQILTKYWGFSSFRPVQEEVINAVLEGKDTLALLPTGGGKSICYQIPALYNEGICLVVSPLIALMKDQVDNLNKKGIKALAINSLMHWKEIEIALENCIYGDYKFLYVSPERLGTDTMRNYLERMNINLIAVDEAHCISQWGYDFRPSYLKIAEIREMLPEVSVLALTATATPDVAEDIQEKLQFREKNLLRTSFERKNLAYVVLHEESKYQRLLKIIRNVPGTGIVYVRSRRLTQETADFLKKNGVNADYYHAGLEAQERMHKQNNWMSGVTPVMVCTNAFGMGIDKPNVRFVVHLDPPDSLEAYFQEAGRAGRDGHKSYAVLLTNNSDVVELQHKTEMAFPEKEEIRKVYNSLANYLQIPIGAGDDNYYSFDLGDLSKFSDIQRVTTLNSLKFLEREGYLNLTEAFDMPSRVMIIAKREALYKMQVENPTIDAFIKLLLRSYPGIFDGYVKINEFELAQRANTSKDAILTYLKRLASLSVIDYLPQTDQPQVCFNGGRVSDSELVISKANYDERRSTVEKRLKAVENYIGNSAKCRSQMLLAYFGEVDALRCGQCDICLERNKLELNDMQYEELLELIKQQLLEQALKTEQLLETYRGNDEKLLKMIQLLIDNGQLEYDEETRLIWKGN